MTVEESVQLIDETFAQAKDSRKRTLCNKKEKVQHLKRGSKRPKTAIEDVFQQMEVTKQTEEVEIAPRKFAELFDAQENDGQKNLHTQFLQKKQGS